MVSIVGFQPIDPRSTRGRRIYPNNMENQNQQINSQEKNWFDKYYKLIMIVPIILTFICVIYLIMFYQTNNSILLRDVSLSGGTAITITANLDADQLESQLRQQFSDISFRKLTDITTGAGVALVIESPLKPEELKPAIEKILGFELNDKNSSIEFSGPSLSENFYKQLMIALLMSFILMSLVIFFLFRTFIPSVAVIFAAFADIVMPLALIDYLGIKLSAAGIAAFLMLIGYSVDTDILLTTRAIKNHEGKVNERIYRAFKTGIFMTTTALFAVIPAFFLITGLPESFRQIFLVLGLGLVADIINTWMTNAGIIKWYCVKKGIL